MKKFLSYGHDSNAPLIVKIKDYKDTNGKCFRLPIVLMVGILLHLLVTKQFVYGTALVFKI